MPIRTIPAALALTLAAGAAAADIERMRTSDDVETAMNRLESAVIESGATVFARVDHEAGAERAGLTLAPAELLIFGNPALGTPAMQADPLAGLHLPLKILIYEDGEGQTWVAYEEVEETFDDLDVDDDADYFEAIEAALERFAEVAAD